MSRTFCRTVTCTAPRIIFIAKCDEDVPEADRAKIEIMDGLSCNGKGIEDEWCLRHNCVYAESDYHYDY